jgi:hypothetical protein
MWKKANELLNTFSRKIRALVDGMGKFKFKESTSI